MIMSDARSSMRRRKITGSEPPEGVRGRLPEGGNNVTVNNTG